MTESIDWFLKYPKHEEQTYNSCVGVLYVVKDLTKGISEEAAKERMPLVNSCRYIPINVS